MGTDNIGLASVLLNMVLNWRKKLGLLKRKL